MLASSGCASGSDGGADESAAGATTPGQSSSSSQSGAGGKRQSDARSAGGTANKSRSSSLLASGGAQTSAGGTAGGTSRASSKGGASGSAAAGGRNSVAEGGSSRSAASSARGGTSAVGGSLNSTVASGGTSAKTTAVTSAAGADPGTCSNEPARGLALQDIAVYQAVKIPVMTEGAEVVASARHARVVAGRDALFRVFVKTDATFKPRELTARLTLSGGDKPTTLFSDRRSIAASSTDADPDSTFQFSVPANALAPLVRYSVEVVDCASQTGSAGAARFPTKGDIELGVKTTSGLKVKVLPLSYNGSVPDTSEAALAGYAKYLADLYPVTHVSITVGSTVSVSSLDWTAMLDEVMVQRSKDAPSKDVYYYGLLKPTDNFESFKRTYCNPSCVTGISYLVESANGFYSDDTRCGLGLGYADSSSYKTMAHELGHTHGREHAPCVIGGSIEAPDPDFPYAGGKLGSWGYDRGTQSLVNPLTSTDIMGYCNNQWISDYTYEGIAARIADVAALGASSILNTQAQARWLTLWLDARGPHWGKQRPRDTLPTGTSEPAIVYDSSRNPLMTIQVYRTRVSELGASMVEVPAPEPNWHSVAVGGAEAIAFAPLGI